MSKKINKSMKGQLQDIQTAERTEQQEQRRKSLITPALDHVMKELAQLPIAKEVGDLIDNMELSTLRRKDAIVAFRISDELTITQVNMHKELMDRPGTYRDAVERVEAIRKDLYSNPVVDGIKIWNPPKGSAIVVELEVLNDAIKQMLKVAKDALQPEIDLAISIEDQEAMEMVNDEQSRWATENKARKEAK